MNSHKAIVRFWKKFTALQRWCSKNNMVLEVEDFWLKEVEKAYDAGYEKRQQEVHDLFNSKD